jgi:hypothetical protein
MHGQAFIDEVDAHPGIELVGWQDADEGSAMLDRRAVVQERRTGIKHAATFKAILSNAWQPLLDVFLGEREGKLMRGMSRIVGYYSSIANWNRSKLAELKDRQAGNYAPPGKDRRP